MADLETLSKRIKRMAQAMEAVKKSGISEEILICWLRVKTGLSVKNIRVLMKSQEEFYKGLLINDGVDAL